MGRTQLRACGLLLLTVAVAAQEQSAPQIDQWPQWRGPGADGVAREANPPTHWSATENVAWKTAIPGDGSATPVVWGHRMFVATAVPTDEIAADPPARQAYQIPEPPNQFYRFLLVCLDRRDGRTLWSREAVRAVPHEGHHKTHSYAAASPVTDGRRVFVSFGSRGIFAWDMDGNRLWQRDLGDMQTRRGWGEGASPALHGETLVINWDHEGPSFIVALNASTGKTIWKRERDEPTSWATPLIVSDGETTQVVVSATNQITSYDLADGRILWQCAGLNVNVIPCPVAANGIVYCMSNYRQSNAFAIPLTARGDIRASGRLLWHHQGGTPYCPSPLLYRDRLYFTSQNSAILSVLNAATGEKTCEPFRLPGLSNVYASPVAAAGRIYLPGRDGRTVVLRAGDRPEVLATNALNEPIDASPVALGTDLFLRSRQHVFCLRTAD